MSKKTTTTRARASTRSESRISHSTVIDLVPTLVIDVRQS